MPGQKDHVDRFHSDLLTRADLWLRFRGGLHGVDLEALVVNVDDRRHEGVDFLVFLLMASYPVPSLLRLQGVEGVSSEGVVLVPGR